MNGRVVALAVSGMHTMSKPRVELARLVEGLGVEGDAHAGATVKHRSRVAVDPTQPNLRQVHLIHGELIDELRAKGFDVAPGVMGENVTTRGIDLLGLPRGALLQLGQAVIEITGLRNPCTQLNGIQPGLMEAVLERSPERGLIRKAGVMAVVTRSGDVSVGDEIRVEMPAGAHEVLKPV